MALIEPLEVGRPSRDKEYPKLKDFHSDLTVSKMHIKFKLMYSLYCTHTLYIILFKGIFVLILNFCAFQRILQKKHIDIYK